MNTAHVLPVCLFLQVEKSRHLCLVHICWNVLILKVVSSRAYRTTDQAVSSLFLPPAAVEWEERERTLARHDDWACRQRTVHTSTSRKLCSSNVCRDRCTVGCRRDAVDSLVLSKLPKQCLLLYTQHDWRYNRRSWARSLRLTSMIVHWRWRPTVLCCWSYFHLSGNHFCGRRTGDCFRYLPSEFTDMGSQADESQWPWCPRSDFSLIMSWPSFYCSNWLRGIWVIFRSQLPMRKPGRL